MFKGKALAPTFLLIFALGAASSAARAEVIEIGKDGMVRRLSDQPNADWSSNEAETLAEVEAEAETDIPVTAVTMVNERAVDGAYAAALNEVSRAYDISPRLLEALIWQESRWNQRAVSRAGAIGLAQLMPATARELGVDPRDPLQNMAGGARYLRQQLNRFDGNLEKALAAYNAGPGRVAAAGGIPSIPETQAYVRSIVKRLASNLPSDGDR